MFTLLALPFISVVAVAEAATESQRYNDDFAQPVPSVNVAMADDIGTRSDPFATLSAMQEGGLQLAAGTSGVTNNDLNSVGINSSQTDGDISDVTVTNATTGVISENVVSGNSGITTVFQNSGNGVIFQSTVQVNVFLPATQD